MNPPSRHRPEPPVAWLIPSDTPYAPVIAVLRGAGPVPATLSAQLALADVLVLLPARSTAARTRPGPAAHTAPPRPPTTAAASRVDGRCRPDPPALLRDHPGLCLVLAVSAGQGAATAWFRDGTCRQLATGRQGPVGLPPPAGNPATTGQAPPAHRRAGTGQAPPDFRTATSGQRAPSRQPTPSRQPAPAARPATTGRPAAEASAASVEEWACRLALRLYLGWSAGA